MYSMYVSVLPMQKIMAAFYSRFKRTRCRQICKCRASSPRQVRNQHRLRPVESREMPFKLC
ncbi:hypothetical protein BLA29_014375 [Euroglyphus maynei]|uniref:Uncharacterized protein n=1 Tax=Euroglyphus maynei TaxID=6958 RepID=A0A1Y3BAS0_EURMA|nr:hypothetical protein BLA29_014375 [Euroglyphus maynei]